jgi:sterile alpha motif and leucine zipper-containing kinase AZK
MQCAVKRFTPQGDDPEIVRSFRNEVFLMGKLNHANLVRFYAAVMEPTRPCIIVELMVGSLTDLLYGKDKKNLPDDKWHDRRKLGVAIGIVNGVKFLHSKKVCHRDLKSPNVLYDKDLNIKLCDFAFSTFSQQASMRFESRVGTPAWMAPEVLNGDAYTLSADIYSLAVIIWEIVTRSEPWAGINPFAVAFKVVSENLRLETEGFDSFWKDLLEMCWAKPHERPTIGEVDRAMQMARADVLKGKTFASGAGTPVPKVMPRAAIQAISQRAP